MTFLVISSLGDRLGTHLNGVCNGRRVGATTNAEEEEEEVGWFYTGLLKTVKLKQKTRKPNKKMKERQK